MNIFLGMSNLDIALSVTAGSQLSRTHFISGRLAPYVSQKTQEASPVPRTIDTGARTIVTKIY